MLRAAVAHASAPPFIHRVESRRQGGGGCAAADSALLTIVALIRFSRRHHNVTQVLTAAECRDLAQLEAVQRERAQQLKTHVNQGAQVRLRRNVHFLL